jgi:hypothetical protein
MRKTANKSFLELQDFVDSLLKGMGEYEKELFFEKVEKDLDLILKKKAKENHED